MPTFVLKHCVARDAFAPAQMGQQPRNANGESWMTVGRAGRVDVSDEFVAAFVSTTELDDVVMVMLLSNWQEQSGTRPAALTDELLARSRQALVSAERSAITPGQVRRTREESASDIVRDARAAREARANAGRPSVVESDRTIFRETWYGGRRICGNEGAFFTAGAVCGRELYHDNGHGAPVATENVELRYGERPAFPGGDARADERERARAFDMPFDAAVLEEANRANADARRMREAARLRAAEQAAARAADAERQRNRLAGFTRELDEMSEQLARAPLGEMASPPPLRATANRLTENRAQIGHGLVAVMRGFGLYPSLSGGGSFLLPTRLTEIPADFQRMIRAYRSYIESALQTEYRAQAPHLSPERAAIALSDLNREAISNDVASALARAFADVGTSARAAGQAMARLGGAFSSIIVDEEEERPSSTPRRRRQPRPAPAPAPTDSLDRSRRIVRIAVAEPAAAPPVEEEEKKDAEPGTEVVVDAVSGDANASNG